MSYLNENPAKTAEEILANAEIVSGVYGNQSPIRIIDKEHCRALRPHPDFAPLAECECALDSVFRPHAPGMLGYLKGVPVYYAPLNATQRN